MAKVSVEIPDSKIDAATKAELEKAWRRVATLERQVTKLKTELTQVANDKKAVASAIVELNGTISNLAQLGFDDHRYEEWA